MNKTAIKDLVKTEQDLPMSILLYGAGCIGKSTFASQAKGYIGLCSEYRVGGPKFQHLLLERWDELTAWVSKVLVDQHDYRVLGIDTVDGFESLLHQKVAEQFQVDNIAKVGYGKGYDAALGEFIKLTQLLDQIRRKRRMSVILISHSTIKKFDAPDREAYDRFRPNLNDKVATLLYNWVDCCMYATSIPVEGDKQTQLMLEPERVLYTKERPAFWAKSTNLFPFVLPLDFSKFLECVKDGQSKDQAGTKLARKKATNNSERGGEVVGSVQGNALQSVESGTGAEEGEARLTHPD